MKFFALSSILLLLLAFGTSLMITAQEPMLSRRSEESKSTALMFAKLSASNRIVEGMMAADYPRIQAAASQLADICSTQNWPNQNNELTDQWRSDLRRTALKLARLAGENNLEGVAHTYTQLMGTCLDCHSYSRDVLRVAGSINQMSNPNSGVVPIPVVDKPKSSITRFNARP